MRPPASRAQLRFAFPATKMPNQPKLTQLGVASDFAEAAAAGAGWDDGAGDGR